MGVVDALRRVRTPRSAEVPRLSAALREDAATGLMRLARFADTLERRADSPDTRLAVLETLRADWIAAIEPLVEALRNRPIPLTADESATVHRMGLALRAVRDAYKRYLVRDESGREVIHPDAPLDAKHTLTEFLQYKADFAQKFLTDPETALGPMVEQMARSQAENIVRQQFEEVSRQNYVASLEAENRDWLFDPETGDVSREGQIVQKYIDEAKSLGIASPQARWQYALNNTERELLLEVRTAQSQQASRSQFEQQLEAVKQQPVAPAPQPAMSQAESNMDYLRRAASRAPSRAGVATNSPQAARQGLSFQDRLKQQLSDEGLM
jgi:hypothetical protein